MLVKISRGPNKLAHLAARGLCAAKIYILLGAWSRISVNNNTFGDRACHTTTRKGLNMWLSDTVSTYLLTYVML